MQNQIIKEQIRKKVARSGNGGAVWVPKDWLGEEILVTRLETPKLSIDEEIINLLLPNLEHISGIFLYGSYARNEETKNSDIDILIVADEKFKVSNIKNFDMNIIEYKDLNEKMQKDPFLFAAIKESKPILNGLLLKEFQKIPHDIKKLKPFIKWFLDTTKDNIVSTREFIDLDKLDSDYVVSYSTVYSTILRLRGIFLINSIINNKDFSNNEFKKWITKKIPAGEYEKIYSVYRKIRDKEKIEKVKIKILYMETLINFLEKEIKGLRW